MSPLNHKKTTSSLAPPIICAAKKLAIKRQKAPHYIILTSKEQKLKIKQANCKAQKRNAETKLELK